MRQFRFRALVTLDPVARDGPARQYASGTHALMVHACCLVQPSCDKYFPAVISRDEEQPLQPGEHAVVTIALAGDDAEAFFAPGQRFTLWAGGDVGHGTISRRVFTSSGPS